MTCEHQWRAMTWQEAYPASSGRVCVKCDRYRLGWLGEDVNAPAVANTRRTESGQCPPPEVFADPHGAVDE